MQCSITPFCYLCFWNCMCCFFYLIPLILVIYYRKAATAMKLVHTRLNKIELGTAFDPVY